MSMMTLKCPKCGAEAKLSLADNNYSGPRRCWKCHEYFTITIVNNQVTFCEPLSKEDYEKQAEAKKAQDKMGGGGIGFSRPEQPQFPQDSQVGKDSSEETIDIFKQLAGKSKGGIDFSGSVEQAKTQKPEFIRAPMPQQPASQTPLQKPAPTFPAEKPRDLTKPSAPKTTPKPKEPDKPATFKYDPIRTFIPIEDIKEEPPKKPKKDKPNPDMFNPFVPPQK
jgi:hypothetical protein